MNFVVRYQLHTYVVLFFAFIYNIPAYAQTTYDNPYLDIGIFAFEENDFASAISHLKRATLKQPNNPVAYHYLAKTYQKMKRYKEARYYYGQAYGIDPELNDLMYDRGYFNYLTHQYQNAFNDFVQAVKQSPDNLIAHYYAGICAFKTNQFQIALKYFMSCVKQNSNIKENCEYYAAVCYFQTGQPEKALSLFNSIAKSSQSSALKKETNKWLKILKSNPALFRPYHLYVNFTMTFDNNIRLAPSEETFSDKDDLLLRTFVGAKYNFVQTPFMIMGLEYDHSQANHVDFSDYDTVGSAGSLFLIYNKKMTTQSLYLRPEHIWLDNKSYTSNQGIEYDIKWQKNKHFKLLANFEYTFMNNFMNDDYDGTSIKFDIGLERIFPDNENLAFVSGIGVLNKETDGKDKSFQAGKLDCSIRFHNDQLTWTIGGSYSVRHYMNEDIHFLRRRDDRLTRFSTQFSLNEYMIKPVFQIEHVVNCSNINQYDYKKSAISFSLRYFY